VTFDSPVITWGPLVPVFIALGAAVLGIIVETIYPRVRARRAIQIAIAVVGAIGAALAAALQWVVLEGDGTTVVANRVVSDRQSLAWQVIIAGFGALALLLFTSRVDEEDAFAPLAAAAPGSDAEREATRRGFAQTEVYPLAMFAIAGMMVFTMVTDSLFLFVALEAFSLPLYVLVALARRRRLLSQEAAVKYFLMGAFSSAVYLFGVALTYGATLSTSFHKIDLSITLLWGNEALTYVGIVLMLVGLLFKLGAAPFHAWIPDAYQGAPTPVTALMAAATKAAAAAALLRFVFVGLYRLPWELAPLLWAVAIATMLFGVIAAIVQTDVKRMLAYSSIAHGGFILVAIASFERDALSSVPFYVLAYGLATLGAFAIVGQVREVTKDGSLGAEATRLGQWAGLGRRSPLVASAMALFLLSLAGIPITAGFVGKFVAFRSAVEAGGWALVVVAIVASAAAAFFYLRLIVLMFLTPVPDDLRDAVEVTEAPGPLVVIGLAALGTLFLGVFPHPVLELATSAAILVP
jgi:NADH-quinone oxidoreductase subunit N